MRFIFLSLFTCCILTGTKAQHDSTGYLIADLEIESGVFLPRNSFFRTTYLTSTLPQFSISCKFGHSNWRVLPFIKHSWTNTEIADTLGAIEGKKRMYSTYKRQFAFGLATLLPLGHNAFIELKWSASSNTIFEPYTETNDRGLGMTLSAGFMQRISRVVSTHLDLGYDYAVTDNALLRDWSGWIIKAGIAFNLAAGVKH